MLLKENLINLNLFLNNEYLDKYVQLIYNSAQLIYDAQKMQKHHIIPRSYYMIKQIPVNNSETNLVTLLYKDHILAHYYLSLCTVGDLQQAMRNAFMMLTNFRPEFNAHLLDKYQQIYEEWCNNRLGVSPGNKGKPMSPEQKQRISQTLMGHFVSAETRRKQRDAQLNMSPEKRKNITEANKNKHYKPSMETRQKQSESLMGHSVSNETRVKIGAKNKTKLTGGTWYNNGVDCVYVRPGDTPPDGYVRGTLRKGKKWYNNGEKELQSYVCPEGYIEGRLHLQNK